MSLILTLSFCTVLDSAGVWSVGRQGNPGEERVSVVSLWLVLGTGTRRESSQLGLNVCVQHSTPPPYSYVDALTAGCVFGGGTFGR